MTLEEIKAECDKHYKTEGKKRWCDPTCKYYSKEWHCGLYPVLLSQPYYWKLEKLEAKEGENT